MSGQGQELLAAGNVPLAGVARATGVYGISFEIMLVNTALAAAFLVGRERRNMLLVASLSAAAVLQAGSLIKPAAVPADRTALLVQENIPILEGSDWTKEYFESTLRDLTSLSSNPPEGRRQFDLIVWPESPAPFYTGDVLFRTGLTSVAVSARAWIVAGTIGADNANDPSSSMILRA